MGIVIGILFSIYLIVFYFKRPEFGGFRRNRYSIVNTIVFTVTYLLLGLSAWTVLGQIGLLQRWGYGFLISEYYFYDGSNLSFLGLVVGVVSGIGLGNSLFIWWKTDIPFISSLFKMRSQNSRATQKSSE